MSEPAPKAQIDIEEFERRLRAATMPAKASDDPLAELARLVGQNDPYDRVFSQGEARRASLSVDEQAFLDELTALAGPKAEAPPVQPEPPRAPPARVVRFEVPPRADRVARDEPAMPPVAPIFAPPASRAPAIEADISAVPSEAVAETKAVEFPVEPVPAAPVDLDLPLLRGAIDPVDLPPGSMVAPDDIPPRAEYLATAQFAEPLDAPARAPHDFGPSAVDVAPIAAAAIADAASRRVRDAAPSAPVEPRDLDEPFPALAPMQPEPDFVADEPRRSRKSLILAAGLVGFGVVAAGAAIGLRGGVSSASKEPPTISASSGPVKVQPPAAVAPDAAGKSGVLDRAPEPKAADVKVVSRDEQPVDLAGQGARIVRSVAVPPQAGGGAASPSASAPGAFPEPKRVRTVTVRPDWPNQAADGAPARTVSAPPPPPPSSTPVAPAIASAPPSAPVVAVKPPAAPAPTMPAVTPPVTRPQVAAVAPPAPVAPPVAAVAVAPVAPVAPAPVAAPSTPKPAAARPAAPDAAPSAPVEKMTTRATPTTTPKPKPATLAAAPTPPAAPLRDAGAQAPGAEPVEQVSLPFGRRALAARTTDAPTTTATTSPAPAAAAASGSGFSVQLVAAPTEEEARASASRLKSRYAGDLGGQSPTVRKAEVNGKQVYRVRVGNMSREEATQMCVRLQASGGSCFVARN